MSLVFKIKIVVYSVKDQSVLQAFIINNSYEKQIELYLENGEYSPLYSGNYLEHSAISQQILYEVNYSRS